MVTPSSIFNDENNSAFKLISCATVPLQKDPIAELLVQLPTNVRSHSVRVAVIAQTLARHALTMESTAHSVSFIWEIFYFGLYHHLPPLIAVMQTPVPENILKRVPENSLEAELLEISDILDEILQSKKPREAKIKRISALTTSDKFSQTARQSIALASDEIEALYIGHQNRAIPLK